MNTLAQTLLRTLPRPAAIPKAQLTFIRHESSSRRLTKRLRLPPHNSFKLNSSSPASSHIIYNPPSSSPSVYLTPTLFLPKDDPRRTLLAPAREERKKSAQLPPPVKKPYEKSYHLTPDDFEEIRRLRNSNPDMWTRPKLAEKFKTSSFFIGMVCQASEERKAEMEGRLGTIKSRWGKRKVGARIERKRRRAGWGGADGQ